MRQIECWTWALNHRFKKLFLRFALIVKRCTVVLHGPRRLNYLRDDSFTTHTKFPRFESKPCDSPACGYCFGKPEVQQICLRIYGVTLQLVKLLEDIMDGSRILIFMDTKKGCDQITRQLRMDGWPALSFHGDKSQAERDWVLSEFKAGKSPIMTATDVAARGLVNWTTTTFMGLQYHLLIATCRIC